MPKAILVFNLPEEESEHHDAIMGTTYLCALQEIDEFLRQKLKYGTLTEEEKAAYSSVRDELLSILQGKSIDLH